MSTGLDADFEDEFDLSWGNPHYTRFTWPAVDINTVLANHYRVDPPLRFTRTMLWDVEVRKAWRPDIYIPSVVREGSARSWPEQSYSRSEGLARISEQRRWLAPDMYSLVLERARLDHDRQVITFLGAAEMRGPEGGLITAEPLHQPLFHVEHSVGGTENRPLNRWRIVHLTDHPNERLVRVFERMATGSRLVEFVEIYIRRDLQHELVYLE
ncbi:hypothetical protein [Nocardia brasiliensis]|uniref:hypothetical protein n=1 Tax=Nocardia brasiliensis TaxID=37326 RepID=UPI003D8FEFA3